MFIKFANILKAILSFKPAQLLCATVLCTACCSAICAMPADSIQYAYLESDEEPAGVARLSMVIDTIDYEPMFKHKFTGTSANVITDSTKKLYPFFDKLRRLRELGNNTSSAGQHTVSIVHLGDSHIQADYETGMIRKLMQHYFGNAGRGLVAPLKMAKLPGSANNYKITSTDKWNTVNLIKPAGEIPVGIAGVGLRINDTAACLNVSTIDESFPGEWAFNRITSIHDMSKSSANIDDLLLTVKDTAHYGESFLLNQAVSDINVRFSSPASFNEISFFGFELSNGRNGVAYHTIGVNGARYAHFKREELLCRQIACLNPDLIIVSLGTNEASSKTLNRNFKNDVFDLVFALMESSPDAVVLLTTPAEDYKKYARNKRAPNNLTGEVVKTIKNYALTYGCPYWDMYSITGGKGSSAQWKKKGLLGRDGIHFIKDGYEFQGELLFHALMQAYNQYIKNQ